MGRVSRLKKVFTAAFICIILLGVLPALVCAAEADKKDNRPERGIALYTDYSSVSVPRGETVQMDMILENKGRTDENIAVRITSVAKGWKATLKGGRFQVTGVYVPDGKIKTLSLVLEPEKGIAVGKYPFQFEAKTADGKFISAYTLSVDAQERKAGADNIQINAAYPVLRGQTDAKFEFSLEVTNKGDIERTFNLAAAATGEMGDQFQAGLRAEADLEHPGEGGAEPDRRRGGHADSERRLGGVPGPRPGQLRRQQGRG